LRETAGIAGYRLAAMLFRDNTTYVYSRLADIDTATYPTYLAETSSYFSVYLKIVWKKGREK
jgi:hypothetical protein